MHRSDTIAKLVPLRSRTDPADQDETPSRHALRKPLPALKTSTKHKVGHSYRQAAKDTVQSALELRPPITFEHFLRRDRRTPVHSRRNSSEKEQGLKLAREQSRQLVKHVGIKDVNRITQQNEKREAELRQALQQVEEQGTQYTRQLDETYYTLLERGEALRQIVRNLQNLAADSRALRLHFDKEAHELEQTMSQDTDSYKNFAEQEQTIRGMLDKLEKRKERSTSLNERLEAARKRVSAAEQRVLDAQKQRRKRWSVVWILLGSVLIVMLGIWIARKNAELNARIKLGDMSSRSSASKSDMARPGPTEDPYLQELFDGIS